MLSVNQAHLVQPDSGDEHTATPPNLRPSSRVPSRGTRECGRRIETGAAEAGPTCQAAWRAEGRLACQTGTVCQAAERGGPDPSGGPDLSDCRCKVCARVRACARALACACATPRATLSTVQLSRRSVWYTPPPSDALAATHALACDSRAPRAQQSERTCDLCVRAADRDARDPHTPAAGTYTPTHAASHFAP